MVTFSPAIARCLADNTLHLILMPTEACNLRCVYCFEEFRHGRMEVGVVRAVKCLLERRVPELDALTLSWFGGEPLLAQDLIEEMLDHVWGLVHDHPGIRFTSDVTTNCYLLNHPRFERLLERGVTTYQVTMDGPRQWHDRKRVRADGRGTFHRIWSNLRAIRDVEGAFTILVRLHADKENLGDLPAFIEEYTGTFGQDPRFKLFLRPLSRFGGRNDSILPVLGARAAHGTVQTLRDLARQHGVEQCNLEHMDSVCYASRANSFVVRADGRLNKCCLALDDPANQVGRICADGSLEISPQVRPWLRGIWSGDAEALGCPRRGLNDG
jgi:uncharacterized protein